MVHGPQGHGAVRRDERSLHTVLEAQLAARTDDYSDFGRSTNPKVALRWSPSKTLLVRNSFSPGFRAPTRADIHLPRSATRLPASARDQTFEVGYEPRIGDPHGRTYYVGLRYKYR